VKLLESPAFRAISSLAAHRVLARIEIELAHHGGMDNGKLPVTYNDFVKYGVHRHAIAPAIRELEALGFIEVTARGHGGNAEWRKPNLFRLTYKRTNDTDPTHEWKRYNANPKERAQQARKTKNR
jgi:hypothetical protein